MACSTANFTLLVLYFTLSQHSNAFRAQELREVGFLVDRSVGWRTNILLGLLDPKLEGTAISRNIMNYSPNKAALNPRTHESSMRDGVRSWRPVNEFSWPCLPHETVSTLTFMSVCNVSKALCNLRNSNSKFIPLSLTPCSESSKS